MPNLDVVLEILTDMNGRVGALQHAAEQSTAQRQVLFDKIEQLGDNHHVMAMKVDRIAVVVEDLQTMQPTVAWVRRFRSYLLWAGGVIGAALTSAGLAFMDFLKSLVRGVT